MVLCFSLFSLILYNWQVVPFLHDFSRYCVHVRLCSFFLSNNEMHLQTYSTLDSFCSSPRLKHRGVDKLGTIYLHYDAQYIIPRCN